MPANRLQSKHPDRMNGYHMILALGEQAVNRSLANMFHFFKERDHRRRHQIDLPEHEFSAIMDPPQVAFHDIEQDHRIWFYLNLAAVRYKGKAITEGGKPVQWSFAYLVNLRADAMNREHIDGHGGLADEVRQTLSQRAIERGALVRHLVLDFEHSATEAFDRARSRHPGLDAATLDGMGLNRAFATYFAAMRGFENPFSLAIFVEEHEPRPVGPQPTFIPGKSVFSVFEDTGASQRHAINLLMMNRGQETPPDPAKAARFGKNWHTSSTADGRFVVSWRLFIEQWLLPQLMQTFGYEKFGFFQTWEAWSHPPVQETEKWRGIDRYVMNHTEKAECSFETSTEADDTHFSKGVIKIRGSWSHFTKVVRAALGGGEWETNRTLSFSGSIQVIAGEGGRLLFDSRLERAPHITGRGTYPSGFLVDLFASIAGILEDLPNHADRKISRAAALFEQAKTNLTDQLSASFLMPAGERLFFKNAGFDENQNLVFDVFLKAVN